jgi:hypothetical protein
LVGDVARIKQGAIVDNLSPGFVGVAVENKVKFIRLAKLFGNFWVVSEGDFNEG